jgi:hypothetical protein
MMHVAVAGYATPEAEVDAGLVDFACRSTARNDRWRGPTVRRASSSARPAPPLRILDQIVNDCTHDTTYQLVRRYTIDISHS